MNIVRQLRQREKGSVMGMAAISMTAILLAVGLAIDVGHWYLVGGELQNAADAAALAAASALNGKAGGITQAVIRATETVNNYEFNGTSATITPTDTNVRFATSLTAFDDGSALSETAAKTSSDTVLAAIKFVKITVPPKSVSVFFASLATNSATISLSRSAVAGQSVDLNTICPLAPLSVIEDDTKNPPTPLCVNSCDNPADLTIAAKQFTRGCTYTIRLGTNSNCNGNSNNNGSSNGVAPGNYTLLDLDGERNGGGSDTLLSLAAGSDICYTIGTCIQTQTGLEAGPVRKGINLRFDDYQGVNLDPITYPPDTNVMENITFAQYAAGSPSTAPTHTGRPYRRILIVPIIPLSQFSSGSGSGICVSPSRFGAFFLRTKADNGNGDDIVAEYIGTNIDLGNGGYNPSGGAGIPGLTTAVLYR